MTPLHADELDTGPHVVRALLGDALPGSVDESLVPVPTTGSSNVLYRIGDDRCVRLPRQPGGSTTIEKEARWSGYLAGALPVPVPEVLDLGAPGHGYPESWSVVRWLPGTVPVADEDVTGDREGLARDLAAVVVALRGLEVPPEALDDPALRWYRAEPLTTHDRAFREDLAACRDIAGLELDLDHAARVWEEALSAPAGERPPPRWLHGDLLGENLLVDDRGQLSGVLDLGGLAVGDPTVDLAVAWELLDPTARETFRRLVGVDDATWARGRAWALWLALMTFPYYGLSMPGRSASRLAMARAVLA